MSYYIKTLFYAIPIFAFLIFIEAVVASIKGIKINRSADVISSLSSGITNTIRDAIKFTFALITYSWLVENIALYKFESYWLIIIMAFLVKDFSGYWVHRLNHRVNVLWNRHFIHHSSEDFNLSCALRQSISNTIKFSAIFMIPGALLGVPASVFAVLGPIHLFMQLWYHTQLIGNLGLLEYVFVTPSHHRVHHAINDEYIDKNYGQILIIWDKIFGTFQQELETVSPIYGTLNQAKTWNPIIINYKYFFQLLRDAWRAQKSIDKVKIWFMPTGWRPKDVLENYPNNKIKVSGEQIKYNTDNSHSLIMFCWAQLILALVFMFHLFLVLHQSEPFLNYLYAIFIFLNIFSYTSLLDNSKISLYAETLKFLFGIGILQLQSFTWFNIHGMPVLLFLIISLFATIFLYLNNQKSAKLTLVNK